MFLGSNLTCVFARSGRAATGGAPLNLEARALAAVSGVKEDRSAARISLSAADAGHRRHIIALGLIALAQRRWNVVWAVELRANSSAELLSPVPMILIGVVASVGMLAEEAERFRRREDGDGGSSGAPEPSSQRKRGCALASRDERERGESTSGGGKGAVDDRSERWSRLLYGSRP